MKLKIPRWNSVTMMIKSVLKMKQTLTSINENSGQDEGNFSEVIPPRDDFNLFKECINVMEHTAQVSGLHSSENTTTINMCNIYSVFSLIE